MNEKKIPFEPAMIEVIEFDTEDIIKTSGGDDPFAGGDNNLDD